MDRYILLIRERATSQRFHYKKMRRFIFIFFTSLDVPLLNIFLLGQFSATVFTIFHVSIQFSSATTSASSRSAGAASAAAPTSAAAAIFAACASGAGGDVTIVFRFVNFVRTFVAITIFDDGVDQNDDGDGDGDDHADNHAGVADAAAAAAAADRPSRAGKGLFRRGVVAVN